MAANKIAMVTGAGSGIGRATAITFLKAGYGVALVGRRADALDETATLSGHADAALACPCDVSDPDAVDTLYAKIKDRFGRLDVLFNNAGAGMPSTPVGDVSWEDWKRVVDVNLNGSFLCARGAFRMMRDQDPMGGRIVNNGSISAYAPRPGSVAYTASKHAISGLTRTIALDGRPWDIACGQIDIGNAATPMTERMAKGVPQANGTMAVEPTMDVQHVADAVLHMASLPLDANILFMNVMATKMPFVGRG
jgi:NAD(P)-dependent dehydrogenase (short-subunit alcohol dehydrogenase family)